MKVKVAIFSIVVEVFGISVVLMSRGKWLTGRDFSNFYQVDSAAIPSAFAGQILQEQEAAFRFPQQKSAYAFVFDHILSLGRKVEGLDLDSITNLINDSSAYEWGETCTFNPDVKVVFLTEFDVAVGLLKLNKTDPQTYSHPYLRRTKWGYLTEKRHKELISLLD